MHKIERQALSAAPTAGQTMIFMIMALLVLAVVIVWISDVHTVLHLKARTQNAGDAAALAAARWQGITLNLIGDLNILQALALSRGDAAAADQIKNVQARLCFVGPLVGLLASQQAAKNNRAYVNPDYTANLAAHADLVQSYYAVDAIRFPEPYDNAWREYSGMLFTIAEQGLAAGPDNTWYYTDSINNHWLLSRNFYEAVASLDWCWFYWNDAAILQSYTDYQYWPDLPSAPPEPNTYNSEVFGLGLRPFTTVLPGGAGTVAHMNVLRSERGLRPDSPETISNEVAGITNTWYGYVWTSWSALAPANDFPILPLQVKPEYDYTGADTVIRVEAQPDSRMPTTFPALQPFLSRSSPGAAAHLTQSSAISGAVTWTAAGKAFGYLATDGGPVRPDAYVVVLPAFHDVRLIPVDTATGSNLGAYDLVWRRHIQDHLTTYEQSGQAGLDADCWYCQQLQTWEDPAFRQQGIDWLIDNSNACYRVRGGGGPGGGTRRGH
ncbi:MAG: pilus assembly protein TadG-related protein [Kiritimatiellae bacterium]|nr:pilus assembly protein TadG-related protein [Kiritimatiellia bacterium]